MWLQHFKEKLKCTIILGGRIPDPIWNWKKPGIPNEILDIVEKVGHTELTPIQQQAIPIGLQLAAAFFLLQY